MTAGLGCDIGCVPALSVMTVPVRRHIRHLWRNAGEPKFVTRKTQLQVPPKTIHASKYICINYYFKKWSTQANFSNDDWLKSPLIFSDYR